MMLFTEGRLSTEFILRTKVKTHHNDRPGHVLIFRPWIIHPVTENHEHAIALHMMHYNFVRIHQTLRCTPAIQAGITNKVWDLSDIADLLDVAERLAA